MGAVWSGQGYTDYLSPGMSSYSSLSVSLLLMAVALSAKVEGDVSDTELPTQSPTTSVKTRTGLGVVGVMVMAVILTVMLVMLAMCCDCRKPKLTRILRKHRL